MGSAAPTRRALEQVGHELGVAKERVRQIESRAHEKLRGIAREEWLDLAFHIE
jgi:DNA-directed RNA polymerase sigma subunit (sigma70/sigma32)